MSTVNSGRLITTRAPSVAARIPDRHGRPRRRRADRHLLGVEPDVTVADGAGDPAPVGIGTGEGLFEEASNQPTHQHLRCLAIAGGATHLDRDHTGPALAVGGDQARDLTRDLADRARQRPPRGAVRADRRIAGRAAGQQEQAVVGAGVTVTVSSLNGRAAASRASPPPRRSSAAR